MANSGDQSVAPIGPDLQQGNAGLSQKLVLNVPFPSRQQDVIDLITNDSAASLFGFRQKEDRLYRSEFRDQTSITTRQRDVVNLAVVTSF